VDYFALLALMFLTAILIFIGREELEKSFGMAPNWVEANICARAQQAPQRFVILRQSSTIGHTSCLSAIRSSDENSSVSYVSSPRAQVYLKHFDTHISYPGPPD
jgi:hypothetical protein